MEFKARDPFLKILLVAILLFLIGMTYILSDLEYRLGTIEHYIAHERYRKGLVPCPALERR